ncbi:TIGR02444 family protein [Psychrosphaera algicola]|uniref:TIGR02444 family protein n=1 Tax=Psychrosphaera algicola TaxID=3023714 RepID=UPI00351DA15D
MIAQDQFWQFSLAHYQQPNVQATMLSWQDNYGANVNLALLCIYLTENSLSLSRDNIAALHNKVIECDRSYTRPFANCGKCIKPINQHLVITKPFAIGTLECRVRTRKTTTSHFN